VNTHEEQALVLAAQRGDEQAFGELYDAYVDRIYRYIYYRVSTPEIAQDLTSEVFLRMVEGLPGYQYRELPLLAWLYRIAHARIVDHYRRSRRRANDEDIEALNLGTETDLDGAMMTRYHQQEVRNALSLLTDEQQQVIVLRFIEGHGLQKTADLLGKTIGAVKVMQHRALQSLNRVLAQRGVVYE
jgi:RNA polymerase sigma-70 factor (ECF subfamily)